jgi:alkylation response protein AidB-like acyl-CoA dehydrogenase
VQVFGGCGLLEEYPVAGFFRDQRMLSPADRVQRVWELTCTADLARMEEAASRQQRYRRGPLVLARPR